MSNCVVGSGGSRLPRGIIAEHGVEGSDHFSHDGDDDDLGFLVGTGEAIGEGLEGGIIPACAEGGHVEDITDRHSTPEDAAVSPELAAVEIGGDHLGKAPVEEADIGFKPCQSAFAEPPEMASSR